MLKAICLYWFCIAWYVLFFIFLFKYDTHNDFQVWFCTSSPTSILLRILLFAFLGAKLFETIDELDQTLFDMLMIGTHIVETWQVLYRTITPNILVVSNIQTFICERHLLGNCFSLENKCYYVFIVDIVKHKLKWTC